METIITSNREPDDVIPIEDWDMPQPAMESTDKPFIQANTVESSLAEIREKHIIPVFIKDNEPVINHGDFIEATSEVLSDIFYAETILKPKIRLSHPIKGRIPEAKDKPARELLPHEKTLYYERMAFIIEIPTIHEFINGQQLSLTVGGVKAYNLDNLYNRKGTDEHFKVFIGFQNRVCTNLCVSTDGYLADARVKNLHQLKVIMSDMFSRYDAITHFKRLSEFTDYFLTGQQFALLLGRCRMYQHLLQHLKTDIPPLLLGDTQLGMVCKDYYRDNSFCKDEDGNINLWQLYNLFTGANKSTYIDNFLDRSVNAFQFTEELKLALDNKGLSWFLS